MPRLARLSSGASSASGGGMEQRKQLLSSSAHNSFAEGAGGGGAGIRASFGGSFESYLGPRELPDDEAAIKRKMTVWGIAILVFSCVAGGPFGIEAAVQAAGALPTVIALALAGALWGAPQALMTVSVGVCACVSGGGGGASEMGK